MRLVKLAIVNVDATVGAMRSNTDRCIELAREAAAQEVGLAVFPEQIIGGYPAEDLHPGRKPNSLIDAEAMALALELRPERPLDPSADG